MIRFHAGQKVRLTDEGRRQMTSIGRNEYIWPPVQVPSIFPGDQGMLMGRLKNSDLWECRFEADSIAVNEDSVEALPAFCDNPKCAADCSLIHGRSA